MKKSLLIALLILSGTITFAQVNVKAGAEVGTTMTFMRYKNSASESNASPASAITTPGLRAGVFADISLAKHFYLQPGAFYSWNNSRSQPDAFIDNGKKYQAFTKYSTHNIQIPVYALYKSAVEGRGRFIAGAGPYISYAFSGRVKETNFTFQPYGTNLVVETTQQSRAMKIGNEKAIDEYKPLDYGAVGTIGYESNVGLYFRAQANYGLANLMPGGDSDHQLKNWGFGISIGFLFGPDGW